MITSIINASIKHKHVPAFYKITHIKPLIEKQGLDKEMLKKYRPVFNLIFVSKILEKVEEHTTVCLSSKTFNRNCFAESTELYAFIPR